MKPSFTLRGAQLLYDEPGPFTIILSLPRSSRRLSCSAESAGTATNKIYIVNTLPLKYIAEYLLEDISTILSKVFFSIE
jgi:hypothetical protein